MLIFRTNLGGENKMINQEEIERYYIDAKKAGEILNLSPSRISRLCSQNRFEGAFKNGGSWLIPIKSVSEHKPLPPGPKTHNAILGKAIREADNLKKKQ